MQVIWTTPFSDDYDANLEWLAENFGEQLAIEFTELVKQFISIIKEQPSAFPSIEHKKFPFVHRCVVHRKITLFYHVNKEQEVITLLRFWNNQKSPKTLKIK